MFHLKEIQKLHPHQLHLLRFRLLQVVINQSSKNYYILCFFLFKKGLYLHWLFFFFSDSCGNIGKFYDNILPFNTFNHSTSCECQKRCKDTTACEFWNFFEIKKQCDLLNRTGTMTDGLLFVSGSKIGIKSLNIMNTQ